MVVKVRDTDVLHDVLGRWKAGIDEQAPERVAEVFTEDAIFQGLHPYSVGRQGVADYYASQPPGMTVTYRILESRRPAPDDLVLGYIKRRLRVSRSAYGEPVPRRACRARRTTAGELATTKHLGSTTPS